MKKALEPVAKKAVVAHLHTEHHLSERRACRMVNLSRSIFRYAAHGRDDLEVQTALTELAARHPEFGFRKMFLTLRRLGNPWNHKRVYLDLLRAETEQTAQTQTARSFKKSVAARCAGNSQSSLVG